jgi:ribosomal protein S18 acetylase RimI-like enzyme
VPDDVPELIRLRRLMIQALGVDTSEPTWEAEAACVLLDGMAADRLVAAVVDAPPGVPAALIAGGVVQFEAHLPNPRTPTPVRGYISSMYTETRWRRRGLATLVLRELLDHCRQRDALVELHAATAAQSLYARHGFTARGGNLEMRWRP